MIDGSATIHLGEIITATSVDILITISFHLHIRIPRQKPNLLTILASSRQISTYLRSIMAMNEAIILIEIDGIISAYMAQMPFKPRHMTTIDIDGGGSEIGGHR